LGGSTQWLSHSLRQRGRALDERIHTSFEDILVSQRCHLRVHRCARSVPSARLGGRERTGSQVASKLTKLRSSSLRLARRWSLSRQAKAIKPASTANSSRITRTRPRSSFSRVGFLMLANLGILRGAGNATSQRPALSEGISTQVKLLRLL